MQELFRIGVVLLGSIGAISAAMAMVGLLVLVDTIQDRIFGDDRDISEYIKHRRGLAVTEHVLQFDHAVVPQETYWDCAPASTQVVLGGRGIVVSEPDLVTEIGTTTDGTGDISWVTPVLNKYLNAGYTNGYMPDDPPTAAEANSLWTAITTSIDAGFGLVANIVAPPSNYPIGVKGSQSPSYSGGTVFHYIALMGYDDTEQAVLVADPGFEPYIYWISFAQLASLIPPKGFTAATRGATTVTDSFYADTSYFQNPVDDSYPYRIFCFRSNDGTFQDPAFVQNYQRSVTAIANGKLDCFIVYGYWRSNWQATGQTMIDMVNGQGGPHPKMIAMIDLESGGNPGGDQSGGVNGMYWQLTDWLGTTNTTGTRRVIGYANSGDFYGMWQTRPDGLRVVGAGYGSNPNLPGQIAHQYTDGIYGAEQGLPMGASPFGNCDMNVADGLSSTDFAAACGVGSYSASVSNAINDKAAQSPWLGDRITQGENTCPDGVGKFAQFTNGYLYWHPETGAHPIPNSLFAKWATLNYEAGPLGYPVLDNAAVDGGECQAFQNGCLYHETGKDVFWVHGLILQSWAGAGYEKGSLGWPTSDEAPHNDGTVQVFEHGSVFFTPSNIVTV